MKKVKLYSRPEIQVIRFSAEASLCQESGGEINSGDAKSVTVTETTGSDHNDKTSFSVWDD